MVEIGWADSGDKGGFGWVGSGGRGGIGVTGGGGTRGIGGDQWRVKKAWVTDGSWVYKEVDERERERERESFIFYFFNK